MPRKAINPFKSDAPYVKCREWKVKIVEHDNKLTQDGSLSSSVIARRQCAKPFRTSGVLLKKCDRRNAASVLSFFSNDETMVGDRLRDQGNLLPL